MSTFRIIQHRIPCQHIREYPHATSTSHEDELYLAVKQYIPLSNPVPQPGDVTIIATTANGFPKEVYEPLWDELFDRTASHPCDWRIRSIWMADPAQQGQSGVINKPLLGNDPNWYDHARDLLNMVNLKRADMPRPIIGLGHSFGGNVIARLSLIHPRLFTTVILMDPVIQPRSAEMGGSPEENPPNIVQLSTFRRKLWPSREDAAYLFKNSPFFKTWDPRFVDKFIDYGLRDTEPPQVTLTTTPAQEVFTFLRPNYEYYGTDGKSVNRKTHADLNPNQTFRFPFYRSEVYYTFERLPELRPSALYLFGEGSELCSKEMNEEKVRRTGTAPGGSGGVQEGKVKGVTIDGVGHEIPMQAPKKTAAIVAEWVGAQVLEFRKEQEEWEQFWKPEPLKDKQEINDRWREMIGGKPNKSKI